MAINYERALLGAVVIERLPIDAISDLAPDDFDSIECREICAVVRRLHAQGLPYTVDALMDAMGDGYTVAIGALQEAGFNDFFDRVEAEQKAQKYCKAVKDAALIRRLQSALAQASNITADETSEATARAEQARALFDDVLQAAPSTLTAQADAVTQAFAQLDSRERPEAIPFDIPPLDSVLGGGVRGSRLYIIGARPGVGKSALAMILALNAAQRGKPVLYCSLEMDPQEIITRELAHLSEVDAAAIDMGILTPAQRQTCDRYRTALGKLPVFYSAAQTVARLHTETLHVRPALIVVDYLQLLDAGKRTGNRTEEISVISRDLRLLSMEMQVPVVALSQLKRPDRPRPPLMSDLRESGAIEQDANTIILLHAPEEGEEIDGASVAPLYRACEARGERLLMLSVPKNRGGRPHERFSALAFNGAFMRFARLPGKE